MEQHEDEILDRLEELRVWQEQQQNSPLTEEQIKLMQQLGLSFDNENIVDNSSVNGNEEDDRFFANIEKQINALRSGNSSMKCLSLDDTPVMSRKAMDFDATPLKSIDLNRIQVDEVPMNDDELPKKAKRPFLKKGEGLTNRFKVNPDYFNLKNLPKYKFAKRNQTPNANYDEAESVNRLYKSGSARKLNLDNQRQSLNRSKSASAAVKKKSAWPEEFHKEQQPLKEKFRLSAESSMNKLETYQAELDDLVSLEGSEREEIISNRQKYENNNNEEENQYNHVHFDSHIEIDADNSDVPRFDKFSTPTSKSFSEFKAQLLASTTGIFADDTLKEEDNSKIDALKKDLVSMKEYLKHQLEELENQIKMFQKENATLIKMKQQHELERMKMLQEQEEFEEKLNDERVKMEVYFHDERMKIKEKHENLDRRIKEIQRPTRKERDEVMRLNDKIAHLEAELKAKEVKHGSAQARLRSQMKQLEKQVAEQKLEIDVLKRDNKRLDTENLRLRRENNGKVLNEINKNIAKLATTTTSQIEPTTQKKEILNRSKSTIVAKVVSHSTTPRRRSKTPDVKPDESDIDSDVENDNNCIQNGSSSFFPNSNTTPAASQTRNLTLNSTSDRKETINPDGSKDVWYPNGNIKKISADGMVMRMLYFNKDIKETNINEGTVKYYFAENNTWQTTYSDGKQVLEFPNGQIEHRHKNGKLEAHFPNGTIKIIDPTTKDIAEKWTYPDGTKVHVYKNDDRILYLPNGHREIHTKTHKRREFPDGAVKIVYNDGSTETRFPDGRIRVKDRDGNLTMDTSAVS